MSVQESPAPAPARRSTSLKREVGLIGLMWASMGSIIGSGWLFGAQEALIIAGPAAIISWVVGALCILVLALVRILESVLRGDGYDVDVAFDGEELLSKAAAVAYDLVLVDIQMPNLDGL